jgi:RNA polymerase sigma-70 factor (ECF subfamily)
MRVTFSYDEFIAQFARAQRPIYAYICTLLPNRGDADEVFQQTSLILWRDREQFSPDGDFVRWGCGIAHNRVRNFLRLRRHRDVYFTEALVDELSEKRLANDDLFAWRREALKQCLQKLPEKQREMVRLYYEESSSTKEVAERLGVSTTSLYTRLHRIRITLLECIQKALRGERGI